MIIINNCIWKEVFLTICGFQARYDAGELITQREKVSRNVSEQLTERSAQFGIILDDISIVSMWQCLYRQKE